MVIKDKFYRKGVLYAVVCDHENKPANKSSIDIIADSIKAASEHGHTSPKAIARWLVTSDFKHVPDREVRFNAVLKAGDGVGAHIIQKIVNLTDLIMELYKESDYKQEKLYHEIIGMVMSLMIVLNPFTVEDKQDKTRVDVDILCDLVEEYVEEKFNLTFEGNDD